MRLQPGLFPHRRAADGFPDAFALWGLRQLRSGHAGPCAQIRRASDNAVMMAGFGADGWIDMAAILNWSGAASVHVVALYDQSGNGLDVAQSTAANQPVLVHSGVPVTINDRPALDFIGTRSMTRANVSWSASALTVHAVVDINEVGVNGRFVFRHGAGSMTGLGLVARFNPRAGLFGNGYTAGQAPQRATVLTAYESAGPCVTDGKLSADGVDLLINNSPPPPLPTYADAIGEVPDFGPATFSIGAGIGSGVGGLLSELALFGTALADEFREALRTDAATAYGIELA